MEVKEMFEQMQNTWVEMKAAMEKRDKEIEKYGQETQETKTLIDKLNTRIGELETSMARPSGSKGSNGKPKTKEESLADKASKNYLQIGSAELGPDEKKALSSRVDEEGGYIVSEDFRGTLFTKLRDIVQFRRYATVIQTKKGTVGMPTFDYEGGAEWIEENGKFGEENFTDVFGKKFFTPHKLGRIFRVPIELIEDADFDVEQLLTDHFAMRFGEIEENAFINGDGVNKPTGLLTIADQMNQVNASGTGVAGISGDDFIKAQYGVKSVYRGRGVWLLHRDVLAAARMLKTNDGAYLWQPSLQLGEPATILGRPTIESEYMPQAQAGGVGLVYGDLSYYWIVDRTNVSVQRLTEKYAEYDQVGVKLRKHTDGAPTLAECFAVVNLGGGQ